ncbi:MAG: hypothetical protein OXG39_07635 [Chloroflexi bacterium]|nr:hypothetical protein [Chloroflexota bacterium]
MTVQVVSLRKVVGLILGSPRRSARGGGLAGSSRRRGRRGGPRGPYREKWVDIDSDNLEDARSACILAASRMRRLYGLALAKRAPRGPTRKLIASIRVRGVCGRDGQAYAQEKMKVYGYINNVKGVKRHWLDRARTDAQVQFVRSFQTIFSSYT